MSTTKGKSSSWHKEVRKIRLFSLREEYETGKMNMHLEILRGKGFILFWHNDFLNYFCNIAIKFVYSF